jgi:membrane protein implicated in regulation of membrane protease activity
MPFFFLLFGVALAAAGAWLLGMWAVGVLLVLSGSLCVVHGLFMERGDDGGQRSLMEPVSFEDVLERARRAK